MTREIKFRAWDGEKMRQIVALPFLHHCCECTETKDEEIISENDVLMQFTGLKDKNGKDIYEGDIIELTIAAHSTTRPSGGSDDNEEEISYEQKEEKHRSVVEWEQEYGRFCNLPSKLGGEYFSYEIIGNIYENPELL